VCNILGALPALTSLDLRGNPISVQGWRTFAEASSCFSNLKSLNGWDGYGSLRSGQENKLEATGTLSKHELGVAGIAILARQNNQLNSLDLSGNVLKDNGMKELCQNLPGMRSLTLLDLSSNELGDQAALSLASCLETLASMSSLNLSMNNLGDNGMKNLANLKMPKTLDNLTSLNLSSNKMGQSSASSLCKLLECCAGLKELYLG